jgi:diguanylate cyclase (GGDEF)-like protein
MDDSKAFKPAPSPLVERLNTSVERWASILPLHLREEFRDEFALIGEEHDRTVTTIETIWKRRDRRLAIDESTGLARRRPFLDHLAAVLAPEMPIFRAVAVLFLDVDNLKRLNDTFGHEVGDRALAAVGRIIQETIRAERDIDFASRAPADTDDFSVSRHGGDEFLIALELDDPAGIEVVAPRIKHRVDDPNMQKASGFSSPAHLTVSMGGVVYEMPPTLPPLAANVLARSLIAAADEQMYESKRDGRIHIALARFTDKLEVDRDHARTLV